MSRTADYLGNGVGPMSFGPQAGGGLVAFPCEAFETALLDLTVPNLGIEIIPAKPGHFPVLLNPLWIIEQFAGTQTAPGACNAGSNPAHNNFLLSFTQPSNANVNAITTTPCTLSAGTPVAPANSVTRIPNAPVILDITQGSAGTGGFVLKGRFVLYVFWVPAGS